MWSSHSNEFKRSVLWTLSAFNRNGLLSSVPLKGKIEFEFIVLRNFKSSWCRFWDQFVLINSNLDDYLLFIAESSQKMKKKKIKKMKTFWVEEKVYFSGGAQISLTKNVIYNSSNIYRTVRKSQKLKYQVK